MWWKHWITDYEGLTGSVAPSSSTRLVEWIQVAAIICWIPQAAVYKHIRTFALVCSRPLGKSPSMCNLACKRLWSTDSEMESSTSTWMNIHWALHHSTACTDDMETYGFSQCKKSRLGSPPVVSLPYNSSIHRQVLALPNKAICIVLESPRKVNW